MARALDIELFPCSGGMAEGFRRNGVVFDFAFDRDPDACASYAANLGHEPIRMDVRDVLALARSGLFAPGPVRLLVADPPCTPWSRAGKRLGVADERDMLGVTTELIQLLRPSVYVIGNVPGLADSTQWHHVQRALAPLGRAGYCIRDYASLDAADYGVPQHRVRPFWIGHLAGPCVRWPAPTHGPPGNLGLPGLDLLPWVTCRQALQHLPLRDLGRPVRLKRNAPDFHPASEPDRPAKVVPSSMPGNGGGVMIDSGGPRTVLAHKRHPCSELDAPARTQRLNSNRAGAGGVLAFHDLHAPSRADEPGKVIPAKRHLMGGEVLEFDPNHPCSRSDRPSLVIRTNGGSAIGTGAVLEVVDRTPDPNHPADSPDEPSRAITTQAATTNLLEWPWDRPSTAIEKKRPPSTRGPQSGRVGDPDRPSTTLDASVGRVGRGESIVKAWPWDRPSTTVCAGVEKIAAPGEHMGHTGPNAVVLSERAATILQGFPEGWVFAGKTKKARWSQLGQAMPPPLAEAVARSVVEQLARTFAIGGGQ